jgi:DNA adenine methylase
MNASHAVRVRPLAPWLGGKRKLARRIVCKIESRPHHTYAEPFVGMGGVFLRRNSQARAEVINDASTDVVNLFRVVQRHHLALTDYLRWTLTSRAEFERQMAQPADLLTDIERAARFLYVQKLAFGGKIAGRTFGVDRRSAAGFNILTLAPLLQDVHERLAGVTLERLPYADFIRRYDAPATLFYVDPPYWGCETDYGPGMFAKADHERLADTLQGARGDWLLSINDVRPIRALYEDWACIEEVELTYSISDGAPTKARELIITPMR